MLLAATKNAGQSTGIFDANRSFLPIRIFVFSVLSEAKTGGVKKLKLSFLTPPVLCYFCSSCRSALCALPRIHAANSDPASYVFPAEA